MAAALGPPIHEGQLQWGHGREAMDGVVKINELDPLPPELQWGHGREAMDGRGQVPNVVHRPQASMGPWP